MVRKFLGLMLLVVFAAPSQAGLLSSVLTFNGERDNLIDQSASVAVDVDGSGGYSDGDVLFGFLRIDSVNRDIDLQPNGLPIEPPSGGTSVIPDGEIGILFAAEIDGLVSDAGLPGTLGDVFSLKASSVAGLTLADVLSPSLGAEIAGDLTADTLFIAVESTTSGVIGGPAIQSTWDFTGADFDLSLSGGIVEGDDFFHFSQDNFANPFSGSESGDSR